MWPHGHFGGQHAPQQNPASPTEAVQGLHAVVPFITPELARVALQHLSHLACGLEISASLIHAHVVPFPSPLREPLVDTRFLQEQLFGLATENDFMVTPSLALTRDRTRYFLDALPAGSLVILATRSRWWPTAERRLARVLKRAGHSVLLVR